MCFTKGKHGGKSLRRKYFDDCVVHLVWLLFPPHSSRGSGLVWPSNYRLGKQENQTKPVQHMYSSHYECCGEVLEWCVPCGNRYSPYRTFSCIRMCFSKFRSEIGISQQSCKVEIAFHGPPYIFFPDVQRCELGKLWQVWATQCSFYCAVSTPTCWSYILLLWYTCHIL